MVRIIKGISARKVSEQAYASFMVVPASGTYKSTRDEDESGQYEQIEITARVDWTTRRNALLSGDLVVKVTFDDNTEENIGSDLAPVRFKIVEETTATISTKYTRPI